MEKKLDYSKVADAIKESTWVKDVSNFYQENIFYIRYKFTENTRVGTRHFYVLLNIDPATYEVSSLAYTGLDGENHAWDYLNPPYIEKYKTLDRLDTLLDMYEDIFEKYGTRFHLEPKEKNLATWLKDKGINYRGYKGTFEVISDGASIEDDYRSLVANINLDLPTSDDFPLSRYDVEMAVSNQELKALIKERYGLDYSDAPIKVVLKSFYNSFPQEVQDLIIIDYVKKHGLEDLEDFIKEYEDTLKEEAFYMKDHKEEEIQKRLDEYAEESRRD